MSSEFRTIYVFPDGEPDPAPWYRLELPYPDEFAEELLHGEPRAWTALLEAMTMLLTE